MHAVIFEVWPKEEGRQEYLDIAAALRPTLEKMDGFISIERFESLSEKGKILSLSFWRDDAAIAQWRRVEATAWRRPRAAANCSGITGCGSPRSSAITAWTSAAEAPRSRSPQPRAARDERWVPAFAGMD
jgi:heme-degrading monooxygenase HmoA